MAFWGIELKPDKPYILTPRETRRRLHLSQATLGTRTSLRTFVQCKIGRIGRVFLCALVVEKFETSALHLEFEEDEDVEFSVLGTDSVYLTGFYRHSEGDFSDQEGDNDRKAIDQNAPAVSSSETTPTEKRKKNKQKKKAKRSLDGGTSSPVEKCEKRIGSNKNGDKGHADSSANERFASGEDQSEVKRKSEKKKMNKNETRNFNTIKEVQGKTEKQKKNKNKYETSKSDTNGEAKGKNVKKKKNRNKISETNTTSESDTTSKSDTISESYTASRRSASHRLKGATATTGGGGLVEHSKEDAEFEATHPVPLSAGPSRRVLVDPWMQSTSKQILETVQGVSTAQNNLYTQLQETRLEFGKESKEIGQILSEMQKDPWMQSTSKQILETVQGVSTAQSNLYTLLQETRLEFGKEIGQILSEMQKDPWMQNTSKQILETVQGVSTAQNNLYTQLQETRLEFGKESKEIGQILSEMQKDLRYVRLVF